MEFLLRRHRHHHHRHHRWQTTFVCCHSNWNTHTQQYILTICKLQYVSLSMRRAVAPSQTLLRDRTNYNFDVHCRSCKPTHSQRIFWKMSLLRLAATLRRQATNLLFIYFIYLLRRENWTNSRYLLKNNHRWNIMISRTFCINFLINSTSNKMRRKKMNMRKEKRIESNWIQKWSGCRQKSTGA